MVLTSGRFYLLDAAGSVADTLVLDVFQRVLGDLAPDVAARACPRVEHAQVLGPADIPRFARPGVLPSMQPTHGVSDMRRAAERLGPERLAGAYAWRSLLADVVVLDEDVFTCPAARIRDIAPFLTMVGGEVVFARPPFEAS